MKFTSAKQNPFYFFFSKTVVVERGLCLPLEEPAVLAWLRRALRFSALAVAVRGSASRVLLLSPPQPAVQAGRGHQLHRHSRRSAAERLLAVRDGARHGLRALTSRVVDGGADSLVALGRILLLLLRLRHVRAGSATAASSRRNTAARRKCSSARTL
jgi:hypothetical protein